MKWTEPREMFFPHGPMTSTQANHCSEYTNLTVSAVGKLFGASSVKIVKRRLKFDFLLFKVSAVDSEAAGMWHARGPHLNAALPLGQRWMPRLLALGAGTWAGVDQTKGSNHGSAVVSSKAKVLFRT